MDATSGKEIRVEMRLRNNRLWNLIHPRWDSVSAFCKEAGFYQTQIGELLNLKTHPISQAKKDKGEYRSVCQAVAEYFRALPEDLFPLEIYELERTEGSAEIGPEEIPFHACALLPAPDIMDTMLDEIGRKQLIEKLLLLVSSKERMCVEMRFGLGEYEPHTYDQIGDVIGAGKVRAEQIVKKALRRIAVNPKAAQAIRLFDTGDLDHMVFAPDEDIRKVHEYIDMLEQAVIGHILRMRDEFPSTTRVLELWFGVNGPFAHTLRQIRFTPVMTQFHASPQKVVADCVFTVAHDALVQEVIRRKDAKEVMTLAQRYVSLRYYKSKIQDMFWRYYR